MKALEPSILWNNFQSICGIPHPSKHEEKIVAWLCDWAKQHNIAVRKDATGNVILSKPATPGMENRKGVILQAHIDMVPQKNADKDHDFTKDPIEMVVGEDGWVRANGTTLGADDGIGCAAALSVLESADIAHGPIEVLITVDEETGMTGAFGLKSEEFKGDILLNLDSETEGELYVGCAGGLDANISFAYKQMPIPADCSAFQLEVKGLNGGHSGMDINCGKGNANKIMIRFLKTIVRKYQVALASINGGSLRNAIPREAFATILIPNNHVEAVKQDLQAFLPVVKKELSVTEPNLTVNLLPAAMPNHIIEQKVAENMIDAVHVCPNGVMRMSDSMENLVETSTNLAVVKSNGNSIDISCLLRSSVDSAKEDLMEQMESLFRLAGATSKFTGGYPGWKPNMDSPILHTMMETYKKLYGTDAKIMAIHAGLECGLLGGKYPHWDMISFGPTIQNPHSPNERVNIESVEKFWKFLVETLKNIPVK